MNEDFIFRLGADVSQFTKSISEVEAELKKVQAELKNKTGAAIIETNKYIASLQDSLVNLKKVGLDKLPQAASQGAASLNALGQVARDAPFGFIAIQNNLPILFDQLGTLTTKSGGAVNALKSIGSALIGPAGITFAIGAAISAITALIQNYGSFGAAIDAVFGKQTALSIETLEAAKSLQEFNKEFKTSDQLIRSAQAGTEGQSTRIKSLSKIVLDQSKTFDERNLALKELKRIDEDYFYTIDLGKTSYKDLTNAVDNYIKSMKFAASAKTLENRVSETNSQLDIQRKLLKNLQNNLDELKSKEITIQGAAATRKDQEDIKQAQSSVNKQIAVINSLERSLNTNKDALNAFIVKQNELRAPVDASTQALKKQEQQLLKNGKAAARSSIGQITQGEQLSNGVITSDIGLLSRITEANVRLTNLSIDKIRRYRDKNTPKPLDLVPKKIEKVVPTPMSEQLKQQVGTTLLELDRLSTKFTQTSQALQATFLDPLTSAFTEFFETGKIGFKEFGKSIIKTIQQIVAKIIATGIINLLASILSGGGTQAVGALQGVAGATKGISFGKAFGDAFKSVLGIGGNKIAAPSFSGVGGGGMQMNGQVVFVQRGSDLVGVLNRTNGTINRVG